MDVTSLNRSKDRIQALAEATREFQYADREREVARTVVDIARDVLGHSTAIIYQFDPDTELLVPWIHDGLEPGPDERGSYPDSRDSTSKNGSTIGTGSRRTDAGDESTRLAGGSDSEDAGAMGPDTWEMSVFEQGDPAWVLHYGDIENPGAPGRLDGGVLAVPLGEHGLFQVGIHGTTEFVTEDRTLVEILGRAARSALDRIQRERELAERARNLEVVLENAPVVVFALNGDGVFTTSKRRTLAALGLESGEAVGQSIYDLCSDYPGMYEAFERACAGDRVEEVFEVGRRRFEMVYVPVEDDETEAAVVGAAVDLTEQSGGS